MKLEFAVAMSMAMAACSPQQDSSSGSSPLEAVRAAIVRRNFGQAAELARQAARANPADPNTRYEQARAEALSGNEGAALDALEAAIRAGLAEVPRALADPAFDAMRRTERFSNLETTAMPRVGPIPKDALTAGHGSDGVTISTDADGHDVIRAGDVTLNADF